MATFHCTAGGGHHTVEVGPVKGTMRYSPADLVCEEHGGAPLYTGMQLNARKSRNSTQQSVSTTPRGRKGKAGLKRGKGFAASKEQREKVKGMACVGCGREAGTFVSIDPGHMTARGVGGCDDADCVIPLCREYDGLGCHRRFDNRDLDILATLIDCGYYKEMAHAIEAHELSPLTLLERLTGTEWIEKSALLESPERQGV